MRSIIKKLFLIFSVLVVVCTNSCAETNMVSLAEDQVSTNLSETGFASSSQYSKEEFTANVMAPLYVTDWNKFENQLSIAKSIGVDAVSVDVWWGEVEKYNDQQFNWSYYDTIFRKIRNAGLDIVAIMSFHQCGGNVGDNFESLIPSWIWNKYSGQGISSDDMKYTSEFVKDGKHQTSSEYVSLWADRYIMEEYIEFMNAFEDHYGDIASDIDEINISAGTAGELRYPSYNSHDWGAYPNRGTFQFYGRLATEDFRNDMLSKYGNLSEVNNAWGFNLSSTNQINVPSNPQEFVDNRKYENTQYGKDVIFWYNNSLKEHGKRLIDAGVQAFNSEFSNIPIGIKMSGIHWKMGDPSTPRIAEITAGLIETTGDYQSGTTGYGYNNLLSACISDSRDIIFHFTCLEMSNGNSSPAYSLAQDLVFWVAEAAEKQGIIIKGENALPGGVTSDTGWDNIDNAFQWASYLGLTVLRIGDVTYNNTGKSRYEQFINKYGNKGDDTLKDITIHYSEFESSPSYTLHTYEGVELHQEMSYEGNFNGSYWWKITVSVPSDFKFCFVNGNGNWDGEDRHFTNQAQEIYVKNYDTTIYTYRP